ncbi:hypothetical protein CO2235_100126 [Cupriavidus oxalaticus]|uniref:Uncharacterized protein n=1 Tax=Cupriavidus oxalaticus TaxID=96344 RepID=A0A976G8G6_9BURK|nr:hypothetical protein CO2235_100126 [Cupriavidus oxalaticus]
MNPQLQAADKSLCNTVVNLP